MKEYKTKNKNDYVEIFSVLMRQYLGKVVIVGMIYQRLDLATFYSTLLWSVQKKKKKWDSSPSRELIKNGRTKISARILIKIGYVYTLLFIFLVVRYNGNIFCLR